MTGDLAPILGLPFIYQRIAPAPALPASSSSTLYTSGNSIPLTHIDQSLDHATHLNTTTTIATITNASDRCDASLSVPALPRSSTHEVRFPQSHGRL